MRRSVLFFCVLMMLLLPACRAADDSATLDAITTRFAASPPFTARVAIRVELPDRACDYTIDWAAEGGTSRMTVVTPEEIAGIAAETDDTGLSFRYEGAVLQVTPSGEAISPLEALPELCFGWAGGEVLEYGRETQDDVELLAVTYAQTRAGRDLRQRVWFDMARGTPLRAELYDGDACVLSCEFLTFQFA